MAEPQSGGPTRLFLTRHYPALDRALAGGGMARLYKHYQSVLGSDRIMSKLEVSHPGEQIFILEDDFKKVFEITSQTEEELRRTIKECPAISDSWRIQTKPMFWPVLLSLRWQVLNRGPEEQLRMSVMFLAVLFYGGPGLQFKYFRRFYQPNAMAYAMNTLSDKFILKQEGTMFRALMEVAWRSHVKYTHFLRDGDDDSLVKYLANLWSRLNGMVKGLKNHYEQTKAKGAYLNQGKDKYDDGEMVERTSVAGRVDAVTDRFAEAFFGEPVPPHAIDLASQMADVPRQSLLLAVSEIRAGGPEEIREVFRLIAELFFDEQHAGPDEIRTRGFLAFALAVYTRSNTIDGRVERVKQILDKLLQEHSPNYMRTNREATRGAFRKGLYLLLVVFMQMKA